MTLQHNTHTHIEWPQLKHLLQRTLQVWPNKRRHTNKQLSGCDKHACLARQRNVRHRHRTTHTQKQLCKEVQTRICVTTLGVCCPVESRMWWGGQSLALMACHPTGHGSLFDPRKTLASQSLQLHLGQTLRRAQEADRDLVRDNTPTAQRGIRSNRSIWSANARAVNPDQSRA